MCDSNCDCNSYIHNECLEKVKKNWKNNTCAYCKKGEKNDCSSNENSEDNEDIIEFYLNNEHLSSLRLKRYTKKQRKTLKQLPRKA